MKKCYSIFSAYFFPQNYPLLYYTTTTHLVLKKNKINGHNLSHKKVHIELYILLTQTYIYLYIHIYIYIDR